MSVRKELLERELKKLGFRKDGAEGSPKGGAKEDPPQDGHPHADGDCGEHGE